MIVKNNRLVERERIYKVIKKIFHFSFLKISHSDYNCFTFIILPPAGISKYIGSYGKVIENFLIGDIDK